MDDDHLIPISALQHYLYCARQCALIHIERLWADNRQTAEGRLLHDRADHPTVEQRHGMRTVTAMPLSHAGLGITGVADVVEFHVIDGGDRPYPVEYKRGQPKVHRADEVQLCAQALCLEAMFRQKVEEGALFYGASRRRTIVAIDDGLRELTKETIHSTREMLRAGHTPSASYEARRCDACSLIGQCQPRLLCRAYGVHTWLRQQIEGQD